MISGVLPPSAGMTSPTQLVAEAWQSAEFYVNKVCVRLECKV